MEAAVSMKGIFDSLDSMEFLTIHKMLLSFLLIKFIYREVPLIISNIYYILFVFLEKDNK